MADYATMRTRIADEMANDGDITTAQINYAIQDAIKFYERREWWFNTASSTFTTVANQEYYTSSDWSVLDDQVQIDTMTITYNNVISPLKALAFEEINDAQNGYIIAVPRNFAYYQQSIRLYPIPYGAYTITVKYSKRLTALSADSDTNAWTNEAEELIRQSAKRRIALNYLSADDLASRFAVLENEAYAALLQENRRRQPNTELRSPAMLGTKRFNYITG